MPTDKYTAVWVSHSSIGDFLRCPRAYYINNVYKDPRTGHKVSLMSPPLALGQAVHAVIEAISVLPADQRFLTPLTERFEKTWERVHGRRGGFGSEEEERRYRNRGWEMLRNLADDPGPLKNLAVKITMDLPHFDLSDQDNIILCGKIDWLEYLPDSDGVAIIDFKTSTRNEDPQSLQLPIYHLLVSHCQRHKVLKASYWYLQRKPGLVEQKLPDFEESLKKVLTIAKKIKLARQLGRFKCPEGDGCRYCLPLEKILKKEAEFIEVDEMSRDVYVLPQVNLKPDQNSQDSVIL